MSGSSTVSEHGTPDADTSNAPDAGTVADASSHSKPSEPSKIKGRLKLGRNRHPDREPVERTPAQRARRRGRIAVWSAFGGVMVIAGGVIGFGYWATHNKPAYQVPQHVAVHTDGIKAGGIVAGGTGTKRVDVYIDYQCPECKAFQASVTPTLSQLVAANQITLVYHPLALLNQSSTTQYSTRAAASAACASDRGAFMAYSNLLMNAEPAAAKAPAPGLSDDQLVQIGGDAGIIDPKFAQCLRAGTYDKWVANENTAAAKLHITTTPTVLVNGASIAAAGAVPTLAELKAATGSR